MFKFINKNGKALLLTCLASSSIILSGCSHMQPSSKVQPMNAVTAASQLPVKPLITVTEVVRAQQAWAQGLVKIGKVYTEKGNYQKVAENLLNTLYAYNYEYGVVLFKPTKVQDHTFRRTHDSALSYFIGENPDIPEDKGFALAPWVNIKFHNDEMYIHGDIAIVMGKYTFTNSKGEQAEVEYTFGYVKDDQGNLKIIAHHSSLPFQG